MFQFQSPAWVLVWFLSVIHLSDELETVWSNCWWMWCFLTSACWTVNCGAVKSLFALKFFSLKLFDFIISSEPFFQRLSWKLDFQTLSTCEAWVRFCLLVRLKLMNSSRFKWRSASHQSVLRRPPLLPPLFALSWLVERLPLPKVWDVYQIPFFSVKFGSLGGKVKHETGLDSQNHRGSSPQKKGGIAEKIFPELDKKVQISKKQSFFVGNMIKLVLLRSLFLKLHIQPLLNKVEKVFFWRVGAVGVMKGCTLRIK